MGGHSAAVAYVGTAPSTTSVNTVGEKGDGGGHGAPGAGAISAPLGTTAPDGNPGKVQSVLSLE
jgi:hypothetical protein